MKRWQALSVLMMLTLVFTGWAPESAGQGKPCLLLFGGFFDLEPADAVVFRGGDFVFKAEADARQGNWGVTYNVQTDVRGFDKQGPIRWELLEGTKTVIETPVRVFEDVEPGTYIVRVVASGVGSNCTGPVTRISTYSFEVEVRDFASSFVTSDSQADAINPLTGDAVAVPSGQGIDVLELQGQRLEDRLRITFNMDGRVLDFVEDAPRRIGCYIDTNGDAQVNAPFEPLGFEYLALNSWQPQDPFVQLIRLSNESTNPDAISTVVGLQSLTTEILLFGLDNATSVSMVCFSEFNGALDLVPDSGFLNL